MNIKGKALLAGCIALAFSNMALAEDIKVAVVGAMSGPVAQYGDQEFTGAEQAVADINAKGGIKGNKLQIVKYDDACDPKQAVAVANKVVNDGIKYVIGHLCSSSTQPASDIYEDEGILMITPAATAPELTARGYQLILRTTGLDSDQGPTAAKYILEKVKPQRIAIVHDKQQYGEGLARAVQDGMFGACLMGNAQLVADCVKAMRDVVSIPVTVKTRIGIDDQDSYEFLCDFINTVSGKGECEMFIIHARKAWLSGLSPKENREIPPLDYPRVYQLKRDFPHLTMSINGGIKSLEEAKAHLQHMDGVMVGREAYQNPGILAAVDREIFGSSDTDADPVAVVRAMYPYIERELSQGTYLGHITRHMLGLFQGIPGARQWRRYLSENAHKAGADINVLEHALKLVADKR